MIYIATKNVSHLKAWCKNIDRNTTVIQVLELNIRKFCFLEFHNAIKAGSLCSVHQELQELSFPRYTLLNFHLKFGEISQR